MELSKLFSPAAVMSDYQKIAKAIGYIQERTDQQPSLGEIAEQVHLSPHHFQRLFSRWAGVSPKRFLQVLTLEQAKQKMNQREQSLLDVSEQTGLSSSSRLYDHFVQLEAVTPSEHKSAGRGLTINWGQHPTRFGEMFIATTPRGVCKLAFVQHHTTEELVCELQREWPLAELVVDNESTAVLLGSIFQTEAEISAPLSLLVRGTNFQVNVWKALLNLRLGELSSYAEIAREIGSPNSARAVGTAIGANPVALIIPCHRVIRQTGELGGYRWGLERKQAILAWETVVTE